jgi:demethylmenaquinone methyltransferase/2-methoxy-6-polyprenyl-1,4-benzoquinol methylase
LDYKSETIKPYNDSDGKTGQVREMFNSIAPAYDFMNHAMTMGIDKRWRKVAVNKIASRHPQHLLDVATGTGDFSVQLCRSIHPESITGFDLSAGMLEIGRRKVAERGLDKIISFKEGNCLDMPFDDNSFDAVTVAFGVRNFEHIEQGYAQMLRVLRPGGMLCVVELSTPTCPFIRFFYDLYTLHVIPAIGSLKSHDADAYRYLPRSIAAVPQGKAMLNIMRRVGFTDCRVQTLTLGTCSIYTAVK